MVTRNLKNKHKNTVGQVKHTYAYIHTPPVTVTVKENVMLSLVSVSSFLHFHQQCIKPVFHPVFL